MKNYELNKENQCKITGILNTKTYSHGTASINLAYEEIKTAHQFHIVDSDLPILTDGIIGRDFLMKYLCKIDYETFTLTMRINNEDITMPMKNNFKNFTKIPPRMEVIKAVHLNINEDSVICNRELIKGVFLSNAIVPANGTAHIRIVNTLDHEVTIPEFSPKIYPLRDYHIIKNVPENSYSEQRFNKLVKNLVLDGIDENAKQSVIDICKLYQDIFLLENEPITANNFYKQKILINDENPVYIKNYRLPHSQIEEINKEVDKLIKDDIVEPSISPYNSPLLIVPKKTFQNTRKWRLVVDFRQLNKKIINDKFPLTRLEDVLDKLGRAKYFSTLDMTSSFHQIELAQDSRKLTAFSTNTGHYQFKRLPFGLKISTNSFQRMLSVALSGLDENAFLYVDDIIVFGCSLKHHNENLAKVFNRLRKYNLKLNPNKCNFLKPEVIYLGHLITKNGIKTDPNKHKVIENYPTPQNTDEVRKFIAFCNYYRKFIPYFAEIAKPLNTLLKKNKLFDWTTECAVAFKTLKKKLINPPILQYPNFMKPFILTTDASDHALGAVLSQGEIGQDLPICYASKSLNKHEVNKSVIEKELLAIHWGINYFRPYLYGRKFYVVTDHRPLVSLFTHKNPSSKMTRIRLDLLDYDFEIIYKQGRMNTNADALSRIKIDTGKLKSLIPTKINVITRQMANASEKKVTPKENNKQCNNRSADTIHIWDCTSISDVRNVKRVQFEINKINKNLQKRNTPIIKINEKEVIVQYSDNLLSNFGLTMEKLIQRMNKERIKELALPRNDKIFDHITVNEFKETFNEIQRKHNSKELTIILYDPPIRINESHKMNDIIKEHHLTAYGGHIGIKRCIAKIKQKYVWKNMRKMIKEFINNCETCMKNKHQKYTKEPLVLTHTPQKSFETISVDTVGPIRISNGYRYILTLQCELTKYVEAYPLETKEAETIAKTLVEKFILKYGSFKTLKTDKGTEFNNDLLHRICKILNINHVTSTPFHHETLGSIERNHRVLNEYLRSFANEDNWDEWIPYYVFCYNSTPHTDTKYSPFELIFGKIISLPTEVINDTSKIYNIDDYANEIKVKLKRANNRAKELLDKAKIIRKNIKDRNCNPSKFKINDYVYLHKGNRKKYESPFEGPYQIIKQSGVNSTILIKGIPKEIHNNRLIACKHKNN